MTSVSVRGTELNPVLAVKLLQPVMALEVTVEEHDVGPVLNDIRLASACPLSRLRAIL